MIRVVGTPRSAFVTAALLVLAACGADGDPVAAARDGSLRGTVADETGAMVANASVALTGNGRTARTATSGADGVYTFDDVPAGTYTLAVTPPTGYVIAGTGTASVTVTNGAQASAAAFVVGRVTATGTCPAVRPDFGGPASAADRALFAYDTSAPLNLQKTVQTTNAVFTLSSITYASPDGGLVTGIMAEPVGRSGLRPAIVIMHPSGNQFSPRGVQMEVGNAQLFAGHGAVVIAIDAPYFRRGAQYGILFTDQDRREQIQLIGDLQRAVDVLLARGDVDPARIAFTGYSYGAMIGAQFVGIERRLKAAVLTAPPGGQVMLVTRWGDPGLSCATITGWLQAMTPIEPIRFVAHAAPTALLFQIARFDTAVPLADAEAVYGAASQPKEVRYYETGHGLNPQAWADRHEWLHQQIGIDRLP